MGITHGHMTIYGYNPWARLHPFACPQVRGSGSSRARARARARAR